MKPEKRTIDFDATFYEHFTPRQRVPEHRMLWAMLKRACVDATGRDRKFRRDASEWLFTCQDDPLPEFCVEWVCLHLDVDPESVRRIVRGLMMHNERILWSMSTQLEREALDVA